MGPLGAISGCEVKVAASLQISLIVIIPSNDPPVKITTNKLHSVLFRADLKKNHVHSFAKAAEHLGNVYKGRWIGDSSF